MQLKKELAKRKGEEAGTKLLFPMILQLGIVMIIVIARIAGILKEQKEGGNGSGIVIADNKEYEKCEEFFIR